MQKPGCKESLQSNGAVKFAGVRQWHSESAESVALSLLAQQVDNRRVGGEAANHPTIASMLRWLRHATRDTLSNPAIDCSRETK